MPLIWKYVITCLTKRSARLLNTTLALLSTGKGLTHRCSSFLPQMCSLKCECKFPFGVKSNCTFSLAWIIISTMLSLDFLIGLLWALTSDILEWSMFIFLNCPCTQLFFLTPSKWWRTYNKIYLYHDWALITSLELDLSNREFFKTRKSKREKVPEVGNSCKKLGEQLGATDLKWNDTKSDSPSPGLWDDIPAESRTQMPGLSWAGLIQGDWTERPGV